MVGLADRDAAKGVRETYQYVTGDEAFYFVVDDGSIELQDGRAEDAAVVVTMDEDTWANVASGRITTSSAVAAGTLTVAGDPQALERLRKIFSRRHMLSSARAATGVGHL
jgi:putative sterol carrier protein